MSQQSNFFASGEDAAEFHSWLMDGFRDLEVIFYDSFTHKKFGGVPLPITAGGLGRESVCLVPVWAKGRLVFRPQGSKVTLDLIDSPVLEYTPSIVETAKERVKVGRIYWGFAGDIERPQKRQVEAVFEWIESHTDPVPGYGSWRMFPHARQYRFIQQWVGEPEPNPLFCPSRPANE